MNRPRLAKVIALCMALLVSFDTNAEPRVIDLNSKFLNFWDQVYNKPTEQQVTQFQTQIVPLFPEFYNNRFSEWKGQGTSITEGLKKSFDYFSTVESKYRQKSELVTSEITVALKAFKSRFPDFKDDFDVFLLNSLFSMDGGTRVFNGKVYFIFGIDSILKYHNGDNDTPFYHHELFHMYHRQFGNAGDLFYESLWAEGLATYVSSLMNPNSGWKNLLLDVPSGLVAICDSKMDFLLKDIDPRLEKSDSSEDYRLYFLGSSKEGQIPSRAGYYIGYLLAKKINESMPLEKMITLHGEDLLQVIRKGLQSLNAK